MTQDNAVVVPPANFKRPLLSAVVFAALMGYAVYAFLQAWSFAPGQRNDLLVSALALAILAAGTVLYLSVGKLVLDMKQPQLVIDDRGIKVPYLPRLSWDAVESVRSVESARFRRYDSELRLGLHAPERYRRLMPLWHRLVQHRALNRGEVILRGEGWPLSDVHSAVERQLSRHRSHSRDFERKLVRHLGRQAEGSAEAANA